MVPVVPSAEDQASLERIATEFTVARWAERCGATCAQEWNDTIGKIIGVTAPGASN
jgi:hypothetical protein